MSLSIALTGDCLMQHRISQDPNPALQALVSLLTKAELTFTNLEGAIDGGINWPAFVAGQGGFGSPYMAFPAWVPDELRRLGINFCFTANNHASDFAEGGILSTVAALDAHGIYHAGTGGSMSDASAPTFVYTQGGRVAVVAASDDGVRSRGEVPFPVPRGCFPADEGFDFPHRPGVNMIRYEPIFHVDAETFHSLKRASTELGWDAEQSVRARGGGLTTPSVGVSALEKRIDTDTLLHFSGSKFALGERFYLETVPFEEDLERNYRAIAAAKADADIVIVGFHHQGASWQEGALPDHTRIFAHGAVDAGADLFVAHGHGRLGGVEIYKQRPIIYGLGALVNQFMQRTRVPREQFRHLGFSTETSSAELMDNLATAARDKGLYPKEFGQISPVPGRAVVTVRWGDDGLATRIEFHPIALTGNLRHGGTPYLLSASSEVSQELLELLRARAAEFGTEMILENGIGVISV